MKMSQRITEICYSDDVYARDPATLNPIPTRNLIIIVIIIIIMGNFTSEENFSD